MVRAGRGRSPGGLPAPGGQPWVGGNGERPAAATIGASQLAGVDVDYTVRVWAAPVWQAAHLFVLKETATGNW